MTKQEQTAIISTIDSIINDKTSKLIEEKEKQNVIVKTLKDKNIQLTNENKELKNKIKELEKQNTSLNKEVVKYEKIFSNIKK